MRSSLIIRIVLVFSLLIAPLFAAFAQEPIDVNNMTREQVLELSYDQLLELELPDLMALADIVGVSADELLQMAFDVQTTTASKSSESLFDSPLSTTVITKEAIEHSGATSIPELFRMVPGMIVREQSPGMYDVHIRGLDNIPPGNFNHFSVNSLTLVMIDGRPIYNYTNGGTLWETLPVSLHEVERIDIIRGASSALYGASAVSGVINIITKDLPSVIAASGRMRTYIQKGGGLSYNVASGVSIPLVEGLRMGFRQNYDMRKMTQEEAYSYETGKFEQYDLIHGVTGHHFYSWDTQRRIKRATQEEITYNGGRNYEAKGIEGQLQYNGHGVDLSLSGGYQYSMVRSVLMENFVTPFIPRLHKAGYADARIQFFGFDLSGSFTKGVLDAGVSQGHPAAKFDLLNAHANLEYSVKLWDQLTIRPGLSFLNATYDDTHWHQEAIAVSTYEGTSGTLGGRKCSYISYAGTLRLDWQPLDQIRVIAAGRLDKYNNPQELYPSYQFAINYKPHPHHLLRAVFARANRSSFIVDSYLNVVGNPVRTWGLFQATAPKNAEFLQKIITTMGLNVAESEYILFQGYHGYKNLKLLTSHQAELGYRLIATQRLQFDLEIFGSQTKNFADIATVANGLEIAISESSGEKVPKITQKLRYSNLPLVAWQYGVTLSGNYAPLNNLRFNLFGTWQHTTLKKHKDGTMFTVGARKLVTKEHEWTPDLTLGLITEYTLLKKAHFFLELYFRTKQQYYHGLMPGISESNGHDEIPPYALCNFTVTYDVLPNCAVQAGVRNLFFTGHEFGFTDNLTPLYQLGLQLSL